MHSDYDDIEQARVEDEESNAIQKRLMRYKRLATKIRSQAIRMTHRSQSGHIASSLSIADILAVLYDKVLHLDPSRPDWPERDRFILSKGHAAAGLYVALAEKGFFPKQWLDTYHQDGGHLAGHVSHTVPGVEVSTGSLGHGLSIGCGMAWEARYRQCPSRIFALLSDGDCNEGSTWEAVMFAAHHKLANLIVIVDENKIQALGKTEEVLDLSPIAKKWAVFGFSVREIDGHDFEQIERTLLDVPFEQERPSAIIAHTTKGKGVSFMENRVEWHYKYADQQQLHQAWSELGALE